MERQETGLGGNTLGSTKKNAQPTTWKEIQAAHPEKQFPPVTQQPFDMAMRAASKGDVVLSQSKINAAVQNLQAKGASPEHVAAYLDEVKALYKSKYNISPEFFRDSIIGNQ